jgi:hypothetical protein
MTPICETCLIKVSCGMHCDEFIKEAGEIIREVNYNPQSKISIKFMKEHRGDYLSIMKAVHLGWKINIVNKFSGTSIIFNLEGQVIKKNIKRTFKE